MTNQEVLAHPIPCTVNWITLEYTMRPRLVHELNPHNWKILKSCLVIEKRYKAHSLGASAQRSLKNQQLEIIIFCNRRIKNAHFALSETKIEKKLN